MKKVISIALIAGCMSGFLNASTFDIGISGSDRGVNGFSLSIGDYYHVPTQEIIYIERSIPSDEIGVVYFLARHSHQTPRYIMNMRLRGLSWWDISLHLGLNPRTLYIVDSRRHLGPPYGRAYGYNGGNNHRLNDAEIVELVNVRFLSSYHGISVDDVIDRRSRGQRYMHIDDDYRMKKYNHQMQQQAKYRENRYENRKEQVERRENRYENRKQQVERRENRYENRNKQRDENKKRDER